MTVSDVNDAQAAHAAVAKPWIVAMDASTTATSVALADHQGRLLAEHWIDGPRAASERLLPSLDALAREFGFAPGQAAQTPETACPVAAVAVSFGPGGFTGLRVGLSLAKTVARSWEARLYGFSTLEAMAARWPVPGDVVCPALDARRGEVYAGAYRVGAPGQRPEPLLPDAVETASALAERLAGLLALLRTKLWAGPARGELTPPTLWLGGSGARRYQDVLAATLGESVRWMHGPVGDPSAGSLALLGAAMLRANDPGMNPLAIAPVYLRPSDAEKRHGIDASAVLADLMPAPASATMAVPGAMPS